MGKRCKLPNPSPETHVWRKLYRGEWRLIPKATVRWKAQRRKEKAKFKAAIVVDPVEEYRKLNK